MVMWCTEYETGGSTLGGGSEDPRRFFFFFGVGRRAGILCVCLWGWEYFSSRQLETIFQCMLTTFS